MHVLGIIGNLILVTINATLASKNVIVFIIKSFYLLIITIKAGLKYQDTIKKNMN